MGALAVAKKSADERVTEAEKKAKERADGLVAKANEDAKKAVEKAEAEAKKAIANANSIPAPSTPVDEDELKAMRDELEKNRLALKQAKSEARISQKEASRLKNRLEDIKNNPQAFAERKAEGFKTPIGTSSKSSSFDSSVNDNE